MFELGPNAQAGSDKPDSGKGHWIPRHNAELCGLSTCIARGRIPAGAGEKEAAKANGSHRFKQALQSKPRSLALGSHQMCDWVRPVLGRNTTGGWVLVVGTWGTWWECGRLGAEHPVTNTAEAPAGIPAPSSVPDP